MNQQQAAAMQSMKEWLSHPGELGREPAKIEPAGSLTFMACIITCSDIRKGFLANGFWASAADTDQEIRSTAAMYSARWNHTMLQPLWTRQKKWWR